MTLGAAGQEAIPGTTPLTGHPIRQVAGVIERAAALVTVESGLWFIAAGLATPFVITPWWLPRTVDWAAPMQTPHRLIDRDDDAADAVVSYLREMDVRETA
jgi:ADP-heptose:LPS heptosyltransferase